MLVCVHCGCVVPTLYHDSSKESICLETCDSCGQIADKYVEWDIYITAIELFLLRVAVFRHLIYNLNANPTCRGIRIKRTRMSRLLLLFASAVVLDGYRVMVTCRFMAMSKEWCDIDSLHQQENVLEYSGRFFKDYEMPSLKAHSDAFIMENMTLCRGNESTTNILHNIVQAILASSQIKIIKGRKDMGLCVGVKKSRSVIDRFFLLALEEPSLTSFGNLTCQHFGEWTTLLLCAVKLLGYCAAIGLIHKLCRKGRFEGKSLKNASRSERKLLLNVENVSSTIDVMLGILLCIHIKALVLMMIIWYPRLPILGAIEIYAYCSNVLAINAASNLSIKTAAAGVLCGIFVKISIHCAWLMIQH
ncbi:uncharacterized protein BBOV_IV007860 [Babesia bovis T2Bo]|uniref:uncharacterized protein n=1 Tax=Babesia bovis T2Bo TaxID=484906 RepID=UPI001D3D58C8|nr:uncharacterized protein BBOV_IV007860 [Babesia bovis T2Bo]EDO07140.2 hypothetical protein BBOV_IV007860 [Babesia bovis T2Bo]